MAEVVEEAVEEAVVEVVAVSEAVVEVVIEISFLPQLVLCIDQDPTSRTKTISECMDNSAAMNQTLELRTVLKVNCVMRSTRSYH